MLLSVLSLSIPALDHPVNSRGPTTGGVEQLGRLLTTYGEARIALESTGNLWTRVYVTLGQQGFKVILTNPYKTRIIAEAKIKNDRMDARVLADLVRADLIAESYVPNWNKTVRRTYLPRLNNQAGQQVHTMDRHRSSPERFKIRPQTPRLLPASRHQTRTPENHHSRRPQDAGLLLPRVETPRVIPGPTRRAVGKKDKATRTNSGLKPSSRMRQPAPRERSEHFQWCGGWDSRTNLPVNIKDTYGLNLSCNG